jgi:hypothetical protein
MDDRDAGALQPRTRDPGSDGLPINPSDQSVADAARPVGR